MRNALCALLLGILVACGGDLTPERHLARANELLAVSDYSSAIVELKNALQLDSTSAEARWLLGSSYLAVGDVLAAETELQRAQDLGWDGNAVRPLLAQALLEQDRFSDVLGFQHDDLEADAAANLLAVQANAALSAGEVTEAEALLALALAKHPGLLPVKLAQARILAFRRETEAAMQLIDTLLQQSPEYAQAWSLKGHILLMDMQLEAARSAFDQAIAHSHSGYHNRVTRALIDIQLGDFATATEEARELRRLAPTQPAGHYVEGLLYIQTGHYREAVTAMGRARPAAVHYPLVFYYLSTAYLFEREPELATKAAQEFLALQPDSIQGRKLHAFLLLEQSPEAAQEILQPVLDNNPEDVEALQLSANAYLLHGQEHLALLRYVRIAQLQPDSAVVEIALATGPLAPAAGANPALKVDAEPALDAQGGSRAGEVLAILAHLRAGDVQGAIAAAESYLWRNSGNVATYNLLGQVYQAAGQTAEARKTFAKVLQRDPADAYANLGMARLALEEKDEPAAREHYLAVLQGHPGDLNSLLQLAQLEQSQGREAAMLARLKEAMQEHPTALEPRLALARHFIGAGRPDRVAPLFAGLGNLQQSAPRTLELQAMAQIALQQHEQARATLLQLVTTPFASPSHFYLLASQYGIAGEPIEARQSLLEAVRLDANYQPALISLARLAQVEGDAAGFRSYLESLVALAPDEPDVLRLQAVHAGMQDNFSEAILLSARALVLAPTEQTAIELATYQAAAGQNDKARNTLQKWISAGSGALAARINLAKLYQRDNSLEAANEQYRAILELEPDNVMALNNLAWNLRESDPEMALEYVRRAYSIAPGQPGVKDTLATIEASLASR